MGEGGREKIIQRKREWKRGRKLRGKRTNKDFLDPQIHSHSPPLSLSLSLSFFLSLSLSFSRRWPLLNERINTGLILSDTYTFRNSRQKLHSLKWCDY